MNKIDRMSPRNGRMLKEDSTTVNGGDLFEKLVDVVGARTTSPAANTLGARLKSIVTALGEVLSVQFAGSTLDLRNLAANKPAADSVQPGTTYWSVDTDPNAEAVEVSNGTNWTVI